MLIQKLCYSILPLQKKDIENLKNELNFLRFNILKMIKSMSVDEYGVRWKRYAGYKYLLKPLQKIVIPIQKNKIKIFTSYKDNVPIIKENNEMVKFNLISKDIDSFIIEVINYTPKQGELLFYGREEVRFEFVNKAVLIRDGTLIENEDKDRFYPKRVEKKKINIYSFLMLNLNFQEKRCI